MIEIPSHLIQQVKEGKVVLLLGSGASCKAKDTNGKKPPMGKELARMLSDKFLGGKHAELPLDQVGEYAISESDLLSVQEYIREVFEPLRPTEAHNLLTTFRWEGIATTNYDRLIESAYENAQKPIQQPKPMIEDCDRIQDQMRNPNSVKLLKLHGCITRTSNSICPLILTVDQYVQYREGRRRLFDQLHDWATERSILFIGHSLVDSDLRALLIELDRNSGKVHPRYYAVSPGSDRIQERFWEAKKVTCIDASFCNFMKTLDATIPAPFRGITVDYSTLTYPIEKRFFKGDTGLSDKCKQFLDVEVDFVNECASGIPVEPIQFYRGFDGGWAGIEQGLDTNRKIADEILSDLFLEEPTEKSNCPTVALLRAHAGAGKSILLKRIAWNAAHDYDKLCLFLRPHGAVDLSALRELQGLCKERIFLFVDDAAEHTHELRSLVNARSPEFAHLTVLAAERTNQWNMVTEESKSLITSSYELRYLSEKEIDQLLGLLKKHKALGTLKHLSETERLKALKERAGRQILVALHEATLGKPFEEIVVDEYNNIPSDEARRIYLSICVLNRLDVWVRAGIISRIHSINFEDFKKRLFSPLENVVQTRLDPIIRDYMYSARHSHISELIFDNILRNQEERFDEYIRCLKALNISYKTDRSAFRQMVKAHSLIEMFTNPELIRIVFSEAQALAGEEAFLFQQMAIFEMRSSGDLSRAGELLRTAEKMKPNSVSIRHSLAEVELKLAEKASTPLQKEKCLRKAEEIATDLAGRRFVYSHPYHTKCKALLMRLKDALAEECALSSSTVEKLVREMEENLTKGLQRFSGDSYLLEAESQFATLLTDSERALKALEQAFEVNKRNSWFAIRISRAYEYKGELTEAKDVLRSALDANNNSHELHYAYAKLVLASDNPDSNELKYHLRRSFSPGDANYEAQLLYGRQLYLSDELEEAKKVFRDLERVRMSPEDKNGIRYRDNRVFQGTVSKSEFSYLWVRRDGIADYIFAHGSNIDEKVWSQLERDTRVNFRIGFNMRGASVCEIWL